MLKSSGVHFKRAFRQCKLLEDKSHADAMAKTLQNRNDTEFWKCVKKSTRKPIPLSSKVNDCIGESNIADMWEHISLTY